MPSPDVIVIGAGFAGLSAAAALAETGARVLVLEARAQPGGRATAFTDRATGELVDNGQHVLFGCYRATFEFLRRVGAMDNVRLQPSLQVTYIDRSADGPCLKCPPLPAPFHLLGGVLDWDAMPWSDRLSVLRLSGPLRRARRDAAPQRPSQHRASRDGVAVAARQPAGAEGDGVAVGTAGGGGAQPESPRRASAAPFVRVLAEMFGTDESAAALALPTRPLHLMYAEPARAFIEARGGEIRLNALARVLTSRDRVDAVEIRGERIAANRVIAAVPWFGLRALFGANPPAALAATIDAAGAMESMPIVTVNLWYDRRVMDDAFVGLPGRRMQWVFDKRIAFGGDASHLSLVSSGATTLAALSNEALTALAAAEVRDALPRARDARLVRATAVTGEAGHVFPRAGPAVAAGDANRHRRALARRRLD